MKNLVMDMNQLYIETLVEKLYNIMNKQNKNLKINVRLI